jgi:rfaE bifunctional protein nucleotidyltransferase chain/domain/rfaE bifunctional protein kinase chain/domain
MTLTDLPARWRTRTVLVVGDALLDGWLSGTPGKLCREAPVPALRIERTDYACGGAANTAANVAALGGRAVLVSVVGADPDGNRLRRRLEAARVTAHLLPVRGRRTQAKRRLVAGGQILVRYDEGDTTPPPADASAAQVGQVAAVLDGGVDAVIVGDYATGALDDRLRECLAARRADIPLLVVDAHDPRPWAALRPDLVTPSFEEAVALLDGVPEPRPRERPGFVAGRARALRNACGAHTVAVTLDTEGAVVITPEGQVRTYARPVPPSHPAGAGDAYVAAFTLALAAGAPLAEAAETAQLAATAAARTPGTAVCDAPTLLVAGGAADRRVVDASDLVAQVAAHRGQGRRIVFTNGCFDVLHRGHVGYLEAAKRLGDVLIVAVNSDGSVRRLKGPGRPVNPVEDRVAVLAGLSSVDHVVVFTEDTPANLIARVRPDVYVKGGDYRPEMIPEAPLVRRLGGEVHVLEFLPDRSTSRIIERIRSGQVPGRAPARRAVQCSEVDS